MEAMESMNIFSALFGIFRQRGLVSLVKEGRSLVGFSISAVIVSVIGGVLYGFAVAVVLGVAGGLYPAYRATRLQPVEGLRHE